MISMDRVSATYILKQGGAFTGTFFIRKEYVAFFFNLSIYSPSIVINRYKQHE